ncbi:MAG: penicillin-binding transpeptidase domain-containing protein [Anaerolineae bacterium]
MTLHPNAQATCITPDVVRREATLQKATIKAAEYEPREVQFKYPHFVQFVTEQVESIYGSGEMYRRGFVIRTTLNSAVQEAAETAIDQTMAALINTGVNTGSVMVTDPRTGAIRAMVGSPNFNDANIDGQVNGALTWQQPGSSIKPVVYAAALEGIDTTGDGRADNWYTPATVLWDVPTTFQNPSYTPTNFDNRFHGPIALRYALQNSFNIPAVKTYQFIGENKFKDMAGRLGLSFPENASFGLPTGIGATEVTLYGMMSAYGTLANSGVRVPLYTIESITDSTGAAVQLPEKAQPLKLFNHRLPT